MPAIVIRRTAISRRCSCVVGRFIVAAFVVGIGALVVAGQSQRRDARSVSGDEGNRFAEKPKSLTILTHSWSERDEGAPL
eukprot:scaffold4184_cov104-Skeletonema_dohrnii-CCMP3373.AAC.2